MVSLFIIAFFCEACKPNQHVIIDYIGVSYFIWGNNSDYQIKFSGRGYELNLENEIIQPGNSLEKEARNMGIPLSPMGQFSEITLVFDENIKAIYGHPTTPSEYQNSDVNYNQPYNPVWDGNYALEKLDAYAHRWTYTFTNADYEAARAISEAQEVREGE